MKKLMKTKKVRMIKYTGTTKSFAKMCKYLKLSTYENNFQFVDENFNTSRIFTGIVRVKDTYYKPGDYYIVEFKDKNDCN